VTWLRCVDHVSDGAGYPLNPDHVICFKRRDGWWRAFDVHGDAHDVCSDDDSKVEALMAGMA
jgi:hypothetical protein